MLGFSGFSPDACSADWTQKGLVDVTGGDIQEGDIIQYAGSGNSTYIGGGRGHDGFARVNPANGRLMLWSNLKGVVRWSELGTFAKVWRQPGNPDMAVSTGRQSAPAETAAQRRSSSRATPQQTTPTPSGPVPVNAAGSPTAPPVVIGDPSRSILGAPLY